MAEFTNIPEVQIPIISIIKEVSNIDNLDLMCRIYNYLTDMNLNPVLVLPKRPLEYGDNINYISIPECVFSHRVSIYDKIKALRYVLTEMVNKNEYDIAIVDTACGIIHFEEDNVLDFLYLEISEAIEPDYIIAHILAEDYIAPHQLIYQLELKIRRKIDSIMISNTFFDIVKYRENKAKRFLLFSDETVTKLTDKLSEHIEIPAFTNKRVEQLCMHIVDTLSTNIGECRKVGNDGDPASS